MKAGLAEFNIDQPQSMLKMVYDCNLAKILFGLTLILIIQSGDEFAVATVAELPWYVQNCDLIWLLFFI